MITNADVRRHPDRFVRPRGPGSWFRGDIVHPDHPRHGRFDPVVIHARALKRAHSGKMMMYYRNIVQFIRADTLEEPAQVGTTVEGARA